MRIQCLIAVIAIFANSIALNAAEHRLPYEAVIDLEDGDNVLSGPGPKYYPTDHLKRGDRVIVHRHDPGGWCMIVPPEGSYSWIRASHVKRDDSDRGLITSNRVVVHTGSLMNPDDFTTIQADLSKGDAVRILGEKNFSFEDGTRLMLKISPVKGEWRWIARKSIVPANEFKSDILPGGEQASPKRRGKIADADTDAFAKPVSIGATELNDLRSSSSDEAGNRKLGLGQEQKNSKQRLSAIDQQFREMIQQDPPTWDLDSIENQYRQLDNDVGLAAMSANIKLRLDAVSRYRKTYRDYVDFYKLSSETKERDAQLMAQYPSQSVSTDQKMLAMNPNLRPSPQLPTPIAATPQPTPSQSSQPPTGAVPAFDGAGIVQRMAKSFPGGPQFVLIAPDGRMLSFLQGGPGVDLNRYNGRAMGIFGQRTRRDDWNADVIVVRSLQPVQLRSR